MVAEGVDDLAGGTQYQLEDKLRLTAAQFTALEESTGVEDNAQSAVFI